MTEKNRSKLRKNAFLTLSINNRAVFELHNLTNLSMMRQFLSIRDCVSVLVWRKYPNTDKEQLDRGFKNGGLLWQQARKTSIT